MVIRSSVKAVSTLTLIILVLCSAIFGAFISYMWVMANYYNMPENTTLLIVRDAVFPVYDARYFNVTILNPSNSASDVNITAIRLSVDGKTDVYDITGPTTEPPLPFLIRRGTEQTFKCKRNWSDFAGETVKIEPVAANASTKSYSYTTPKVKLILKADFEDFESVEYFDLTIENSAESIVNLTISNIEVFDTSINENVTPPITPHHVLSPGQKQIFRCNWNWENYRNIKITVKTAEGYESIYVKDELPGAFLYIDEVRFDYKDTTYFNLTISNSEDSTVTAIINRVNLTLPDETTITLNTTPPLDIIPIPIRLNESLTIRCIWDWNTYRSETVTVKVYTKQGFTAPSKTVRTPPDIVCNITDVKFDFDDTEHFSVNVTNMPCSLQEINVTKILLDKNETIIDRPVAVKPDEQKVINCAFPWKDWINKTATVTVFTEGGLNVSRTVEIPPVGLKLLGDNFVFGDLRDLYVNVTIPIPYVNITVSNSVNSLQNVTIARIILETGNKTYEIDNTLTYPKLAPSGYILGIGENITIICLWDWTLYLGPNPIKVTVYTEEGFQISRTWLPSVP